MELPIKSILDNDLYKLSMQNAVLKLYPRVKVKYKFYNRGKTNFPPNFAENLRMLVKKMEGLCLKKDEKEFLINKTGHYLDPLYIDFLEGYMFNSSEVGIIQNGGNLEIQIAGYWYRTILWEVPLMAIISELYFKMTGKKIDPISEITNRAQGKANKLRLEDARFAEFGTRRRFSCQVQLLVTGILKDYGKNAFVGTSNVHLAHLYDTEPIGTMAHEWIMFHAAMYGAINANYMALKNWKSVYKGYLGTALSDTYTTENFFNSFDKEYAELFTGIRQDSGDPIEFAEKAIVHYKSLDINPESKTIVFSDGLDVLKAVEILNFCRGKIKSSFGIGTNFSNDVGVKPLNIVIKLDEVEIDEKLIPVVKLSDSKGKHTGNAEMIKLVMLNLGLKESLKESKFLDEYGNVTVNYEKLFE